MENLNSNYLVIQSVFSASDIDNLTKYFKRIWMSDATYKVAVARRAFNLNQVFIDALSAGHDENYRTDDIISDTALLLYAEELADYYRAFRSFPSILIADDILVYGRRIAEIISDLETLIVWYLKKIARDTNSLNRQSIHRELLKNITIYVYAENKEGILLNREYNVISEKALRCSELKILSQKISSTIQNSTVRNTSCFLSVNIPSADMFGGEDASMFRYRGRTMQFMYRQVGSYIHETARTYRTDYGKPDRFVTFSIIFGDIGGKVPSKNIEFLKMCESVGEVLSELAPSSRFAHILNIKHIRCFSPKAQVLSFLMSMLSFIDFYTETFSRQVLNGRSLIFQSDFVKIASNFDYPNRILSEIIFLFNEFCRDENLRRRITSLISGDDSGYASETGRFRKGLLNSKDFYWLESKNDHYKAEDIFYVIGLDGEKAARKELNTDGRFDVDRMEANYIDFRNYIKIMNGGPYPVSKAKSIGCLLALMDSGLCSTYFAASDKDQRKFKTYLKAGELSTCSLLRRFCVFVPALAEIEGFAEKNAYNADALIVRFVKYLIKNNLYSSQDNQFEQNLLYELNSSINEFLYMRQCGQKFRDWNIGLLTKEDMESFGLNDDGTYSMQKYFRRVNIEPKLERHYAFCSEIFLRSFT